MHHCLTVAEILDQIFTEFRKTRDPCELARLAQTCQIFSAPALAILWRDRISLQPLIQCMPADLWAITEVEENVSGTVQNTPDIVKHLVFVRGLRESDWDRFDFYASKVRRYGDGWCDVRFNSRAVISKDVFLTLRKSRPHSTAFPNLRHLEVCMSSSLYSCPPLLPEFFLGPTITSMYLRSPMSEQYEPEFTNLIMAIKRICPELHHFKFTRCTKLSDKCLSHIFDLILNLRYLRALSWPLYPLPKMLVSHLRHLSSLVTLRSIVIPSKDVELSRNLNGAFLNLEELYVVLDDWSESSTALLLSLSCTLKSLRLSCNKVPEPFSVLRGFVNVLQTSSSFGSLSTIELSGSRIILGDLLDAEAIMSDIIRPLFPLQLRTLSLYFHFLKLLGNSQLREMAEAWPLLEKVELLVAEEERVAATFDGIISFLRHCPRLKKIAMSVEIDTWNPCSAAVDDACARSLQELSIFHSGGKGDRQLVQSLQRVFPRSKVCISSDNSITIG